MLLYCIPLFYRTIVYVLFQVVNISFQPMQQLDSFSLGPGESSPEVEISREQLDTCNRLRNPRHMPPYGIPIRKISEVSSFLFWTAFPLLSPPQDYFWSLFHKLRNWHKPASHPLFARPGKKMRVVTHGTWHQSQNTILMHQVTILS